MVGGYIMKMIKSHKAKLNHVKILLNLVDKTVLKWSVR